MTLAAAMAGTATAHRISPWCLSRSKRCFDCVVSCGALVVLAPLFGFIAVLLKASEPSAPVLFRHRRVGVFGREFDVLKFRTMRTGSGAARQNLTMAKDGRVTRLGRVLRKFKLDELPQLVNVLRGEMSLVGPRPDAGEFIASLPPSLLEVLALRPGITGAASLRYRNEEAEFANVRPELLNEHYVNAVLPRKAQLDLEYAQNATFLTDLKILMRTVSAITH